MRSRDLIYVLQFFGVIFKLFSERILFQQAFHDLQRPMIFSAARRFVRRRFRLQRRLAQPFDLLHTLLYVTPD